MHVGDGVLYWGCVTGPRHRPHTAPFPHAMPMLRLGEVAFESRTISLVLIDQTYLLKQCQLQVSG